MRTGFLLLLAALSAPAAEFVQAVEFPYQQFPRHLWERELVWLKNVGIGTVAFSIPADAPPGDPRSDLPGLLRLLRGLGLRAWILQAPRGRLAGLEPQLASHGGPIAFVEGGGLGAPPAPAPIVRLSAADPYALSRSRVAFANARGSLLWQDVEDTPLRKGVVSLSGQERPGAAVLRRDAALLRHWSAILPHLRVQRRLPGKAQALQLYGPGRASASAISVFNPDAAPARFDLQAFDPRTRKPVAIPGVEAPPGEALWLPVNVPLASGGLCQDCTAFAPPNRIVYATAELHTVEYENGILAFEFFAPSAGEIVVQLSRKPSGPFLAAGHPAEFTWDEATSTARLPVPRAKTPPFRVRVGLAIEPPESAAFFNDPGRLIIGRANLVSTSYSSEDLAGRSRLLLPPGFAAKALPKSALEIDYEITPPSSAAHGEFVHVALEADGVRLGRARLQVLRPASIRILEAQEELPVNPPRLSIDSGAGRNLRVSIRNNSSSIQNYALEASGEGLTFLPPRQEVSVGARAEREMSLRVFAEDRSAALRRATLRLSGAAEVTQPVCVAAFPKNQAMAYSLDLDGDGVPDWTLENQRVRAAFSGADGRWLEFVWKDSGVNFLPEAGALPMAGRPQFQASHRDNQAVVEIGSSRGRRTLRLAGGDGPLIWEQDGPPPFQGLEPATKDGVSFGWEKTSPGRTEFFLRAPLIE